MKIAVIGAGVTGIATAYELARDGLDVTVYESNSAVAEATSFATGPLMSPGLTNALAHAPWPDRSRVAGLFRRIPLRLRRSVSVSDLRWLLRWKLVASAPFLKTLAAQSALAQASLQRFSAICHDEGLVVEQGEGHTLLLDSEQQLSEWQAHLDWLSSQEIRWQVLTPAQVQKLEPGLFMGPNPRPAIHFSDDRVANCRQFAQLLRERAHHLGARFEMGQRVAGFSSKDKLEVHCADGADPARFDHVILCTGAGSKSLLRSLGHSFSMAQVHSYSLSANIREPLNAPRAAVSDWGRRITMVRMGNRVRMTGGAELGTGSAPNHAASVRSLYQAIQQDFPGAIHHQTGTQLWRSASLFSADGAPLIGPSRTDRLWLNTAHGHQGWALACGSARLLADLIQGKTPAVDPVAFSPERFTA